MAGRPGGHFAYARGTDLVIEWYDHGDDAPYESANLLIFGPLAQRRLASVMGAPDAASADTFAAWIAARFRSYWEVRDLAQEHGVPFAQEVDFQPLR